MQRWCVCQMLFEMDDITTKLNIHQMKRISIANERSSLQNCIEDLSDCNGDTVIIYLHAPRAFVVSSAQ